MQYRPFGKDGWKISALGFGAMRLPATSDGTGVDVEQSIGLIRYGIDHGINYIDTAYIYHDGHSEEIVAQALENGYRNKVRIATKSPGHLVKTADDFERILDEQCSRLRTDRIDYYLFHGIGDTGFDQILSLDLLTRMENARSDGRIGHIGFSFHDNFKSFKRIIDGYDGWEFCQIQFNYMDVDNQAGTTGLLYAASKNIPVIIMEPLLGGRLARPPQPAPALFAASKTARSPAAWSLRWIWNHPEVSCILSGMNSTGQLDENCAIAAASLPMSMSDEDVRIVESVRTELEKRTIIPCTECKYCMPCPAGVEIPWNLTQYNAGKMYDDPGSPRWVYANLMKPDQRASACVACGACEEKCPQKIGISGWMPGINAVLGENAPYPEG